MDWIETTAISSDAKSLVQFKGIWVVPGSPYVNTEVQVRIFEIDTHPFFIGTLFQPERSALRGLQHPLINAFIEAITKA